MRPDDIRPGFQQIERIEETHYGMGLKITIMRNPDAHPDPCEVYWGSHGCARPKGHDGPHWCDCCKCDDHDADHEENGCVAGPPYYGDATPFYGDDA